MTDSITRESVLSALRMVQDPELHKDLVTLNMVRDIQISGKEVSFTIILTTPACPLRTQIEQDARQTVIAQTGASKVNIKMDARVPSDGRQRGTLSLPVKHVVAVASGKGGVGKSTVAVNLAVALAQSGAKVGLLDADIYGPNVPTMMGVRSLAPQTVEGKINPATAYGVQIMSIGFLVKPGQPLIWRGPMLHSAIRQFLADVTWDALDYLIIDLPPGTGDAQLSVAQSVPLSGAVIVTLPQAVSQEDALRGMRMFEELKVPILGVVENMSYLELADGTRMDLFGQGGGRQMAEKAGLKFLGDVPIESIVREGGDQGLPVVAAHPDSAAGKALRGIAEQVAAALSVAALQSTEVPTIEIVE